MYESNLLEPKEFAVVLKTLSERHGWYIKQLEAPDLAEDVKTEYTQSVTHLNSAIKKLAALMPKPKPKPAPPPEPSPDSKPKRKPNVRYEAIEPEKAQVLIAEDSPDSAELLVCLLEDMNITNVEVVKDGKQALNKLKHGDTVYDIVLCDWDMPFLTGMEVCKQARPMAKFQNTTFMMVTAAQEVSRIKQAISIGINDYIVKPVDADILEKKVKAALAGYTPPEEPVAKKPVEKKADGAAG